ncbi:hypothetical protein [Streptomyces sp. NPDC093223]
MITRALAALAATAALLTACHYTGTAVPTPAPAPPPTAPEHT